MGQGLAAHAATLAASKPSEFAGLSLKPGNFSALGLGQLGEAGLDRLTNWSRTDSGDSLKSGVDGFDTRTVPGATGRDTSGCLGCWRFGLPEVGIEGNAEQGVKADSEACAAFSGIGIESGG